MNLLVFGAGAVGSLFGARIAASGHRVILVGRPDHVRAIRERGLRVEGLLPGCWNVDAATDLASVGPVEATLVTVKTFDLATAGTALGRALPPSPTLLLQNGLGIEPTFLGSLHGAGWARPEAWVVRGIHSIPATWEAPGVVRASGTGEVILPEPARHGALAPSIERFHALLTEAGLAVRLSAEFEREVWRKVLVNAAINPVTALHGVPNGRLLRGPLRTEALHLLHEARSVALVEGFDLTGAEVAADFDRVVRATARNRSSMLQDLDHGRPTEVEAISGELLRRAAVHGLDLPKTQAVTEALRRRVGSAHDQPKA